MPLDSNQLQMLNQLEVKIIENDFFKTKVKFDPGSLPKMEDLKPPYNGTFKPVWTGLCYTADGAKQATHIFSSTKQHKDKEYNCVSVRPVVN
jgi:hypothetical protein